jgi:hypothetical protein
MQALAASHKIRSRRYKQLFEAISWPRAMMIWAMGSQAHLTNFYGSTNNMYFSG